MAVLSRGLASAADDGWRTPPAPETGTGVVGLASASDAAAGAVVEVDPASEDERIDEEAGGAKDVIANELSVDAAALLDETGMNLVTVIMVVDPQPRVGDKDVATT